MDDEWKKMELEEVRVPQYEYRATKYGTGRVGRFLGDLVGRAIIPAAAAYAAHKLGVPHEYLMLAPGLLLIPPIFRAGRKLGNLCGRVGAYIGRKLPCDFGKGTVTHHNPNIDIEKVMEQIGRDYIEAGYDFEYKRIDDFVVHPE